MEIQRGESRNDLLDSVIDQAIILVGDEVAREVAIEVFGIGDVTETFARRP